MTQIYHQMADSPVSVFNYPETIEQVKSLIVQQMRIGAQAAGLTPSSERDLRWLPPQFLILVWQEGPTGEEICHRVVAKTIEEATHVRIGVEATFD